jgi:hypothetical protein
MHVLKAVALGQAPSHAVPCGIMIMLRWDVPCEVLPSG